MAQGDVTVYDDFIRASFEKVHDLENDTIKCALVTSTYTPSMDDPIPCWGAGGTTNASTNEVVNTGSPGGYTAGGNTCANPSVTISGSPALVQIDFDDPATWSQDASSPTNARWGIIYNDTASNKECIAFVDLGADFDMTTGDLTITWGAPFATANQA